MSAIPVPALLLGLAGVLPFWAAPLAIWWDPTWWEVAHHQQLVYGALILSFLGGVHWGVALKTGDRGWSRFVWSVLPSLIGWLAHAFEHHGILILICGFGTAWSIDRLSALAEDLPVWYQRLRALLSVGAVAGLAATILVS
jgi:ABC-type proline/glycine betaine transport system permease subunit